MRTVILRARGLITDFFTRGHTRSLEAKKNILATFLVKGISIAISLVLVPLTINYVNPSQYGIWLTLSSIVAWFSFFDIGFGNGLRNKFAESKAKGSLNKARIYISTTYAALIVIFSGIWLLFFIANFFINWSKVLNAPGEMARELSTLALIVFSFFCLQIILKTINTIFIADQKPAKASLLDMLGQLIALVIIAILTITTKGSLLLLGITLGFAPILVLIISNIWFFRGKFRQFAPSLKYVRFSYAKDLMKLGVKFFILQIAYIIIYEASNIIIAQVCGPKDVTIYNIAFKYFGIATMAFSIIMTPFWSAFTDAFAVKDYNWMKRTYKHLQKVTFLLMAGVLVMLLASGTAYHLWIGDVVTVKTSISVAVALYVIVNIWNSLHSALLNGMGKIRLQLYISMLGTAFNIPLAIVLGRKFGVEGVVMAAVLLNLISMVYSPIQVIRLLNNKAKGIWNA